MRIGTLAATLVLSLGMVQSAWAEGGRQKLNEFFTQVNTMQSGFIQEVFDDKGKLKQKSRGVVFLQRPGRFRWQYAEPEQHVIVADGRNVWVHDVELEQVTVKPTSRALSAAPVGMLLNKQPVEAQFQVQEMKAEGSRLEWFHLIPHKKDSDFTSMDLGVSAQGIQEMVLEDKFGQQTYIHFQGMKLNQPADPNRFKFTPPANADVIGQPS